MSKKDEYTVLKDRYGNPNDTGLTVAQMQAKLYADISGNDTIQAPRDFYGKSSQTDLIAGQKFQSFERREASALTILVTQTLYVTPIWLPAGEKISSISYANGAATVTPAHWLVGLFNSSRVLLASSTDDTSTVWAINTIRSTNLTAAYETTYTGWHYCGVAVDASTLPTVANRPTVCQSLALGGTAGDYLRGVPLGGLAQASITTALPSTFTAPSAVGIVPWCSVA